MLNSQTKKAPKIEGKIFESFVKKGDESAQNGHTSKAIEYYSLALELKPTDNPTLVKLGHAFCNQHDKEQAMACYLQAAAMDEQDVWAKYWFENVRYYG
jgi:Flp pilus assembly protein TadD